MIGVAQARAIMLGATGVLDVEDVALDDASGRILAEAIAAPRAQPPFAAAAMDGYAVRAADTPGALRVIGESAAGRGFGLEVRQGEAVRIFTGAPVPAGADAIVIQENAVRTGDTIAAPATPKGHHVRAAGLDFDAGATLLSSGRQLDAHALALVAAAGRSQVRVVRPPRVALLCGGDEIVAPGGAAEAFQVFDSASIGVASLVQLWVGRKSARTLLRDDPAEIARAAQTALKSADLVVTIGGASVGERDHARAVFDRLGAELLVARVSVRPGKPTWFATCADKLVLGLPGNPASALVCARLFLRPLLDAMLGRDAEASLRPTFARLETPLSANGPREAYLRASSRHDGDGQLWVLCATDQDSSLLLPFTTSDRLVLQRPNAPAVAAGELVETLALS